MEEEATHEDTKEEDIILSPPRQFNAGRFTAYNERGSFKRQITDDQQQKKLLSKTKTDQMYIHNADAYEPTLNAKNSTLNHFFKSKTKMNKISEEDNSSKFLRPVGQVKKKIHQSYNTNNIIIPKNSYTYSQTNFPHMNQLNTSLYTKSSLDSFGLLISNFNI